MTTTTRQLIMHVDDDSAMLKIVAKRLNPHGFEVISVTEPKNVVRELVKNKCRFVLLEIEMPGKNGLDVLREIKAHDGGIQVVMLTGMVSMSVVLGRCDGEPKPVFLNQLSIFRRSPTHSTKRLKN